VTASGWRGVTSAGGTFELRLTPLDIRGFVWSGKAFGCESEDAAREASEAALTVEVCPQPLNQSAPLITTAKTP
jgi:hypothetical protein